MILVLATAFFAALTALLARAALVAHRVHDDDAAGVLVAFAALTAWALITTAGIGSL